MENRVRCSGGIARAALAALALSVIGTASQASAQPRAPRAAAPVAAQEASAEGVVNIQTASAEELQRLPGIGPSKAAAIISFRQSMPFRRVEDILRVRGIGRATFRRLRPLITVSGATTLTTDVRMPRSAPASEEDGEQETH